ncbi:hypothetical protein CRG98_042853 [Punica granatum]|uniref:Integrase catalytic domain-containing protein n=1 Tax=Punica granatum TaxID=22663 RepID=A0A2I0HYI8_PUNGR|nr:hypothetical protein CRG98_042853 [Punica granatum]
MSWINFLKTKAEVADMFEKFKSYVETQCSKKILSLRSNNGIEYTSSRFRNLCVVAGIEHQFTAPYSHQQNGVSERKNRSIMEMARCLMHKKELPNKFWVEATNIVAFLLNKLPTGAVDGKTPYEAWYGTKPNLKNLRVFGCLCYSHIPLVKRSKMDEKSELGIFIGYCMQSKGYRIYQPQTDRVVVSRDVVFMEEEKWSWESKGQVQTQASPQM